MISNLHVSTSSTPRIVMPIPRESAFGVPARGRRMTAGMTSCVQGSGLSTYAFGAFVPAFATTKDAVAGVRAWSPPV